MRIRAYALPRNPPDPNPIMWSRPFEPIAQDPGGLALTKAILEQFHRYCPDPGLAPTTVQVDRSADVNDYLLLRLLEGEGTAAEKETYGLYAPGDFRPLDRMGDRLTAMRYNTPWRGTDEAFDDLSRNWERYAAQTSDRKLKLPLRVQAAMPVERWGHAQGKGIDLFDALKKGGTDIEDNTLIRVAPLSFYRNYQLLEVLYPEQIHYRRGYCLFKEVDGGLDVRPVTGKSDVFHDINAMPGELLLDTEAQVRDYIRMFGWGVVGDEGPFLVPQYRREMDFHRPLDADQLQNLPPELTCSTVDPADAADLGYQESTPAQGRQRALVVYGNAVFLAAFAVESNGNISMVDDVPVLADLPLVNEPFGSGNLLVPGWRPDRTAPPTAPPDAAATDAASGAEGAEPGATPPAAPEAAPEIYGVRFTPNDVSMGGAEFLSTLKRTGLVSGRPVGDEVTLDLEQAGVESRGPTIWLDRMYFRNLLHLVNIPEGRSLVFRKCIFAAGLDAHLARIGGELRFEKCTFEKFQEKTHARLSLDLSGSVIAGDVRFRDCHLKGSLFADNVRVSGNFYVQGCYIGTPPVTQGQSSDVPHWLADATEEQIDRLRRGIEGRVESDQVSIHLEKADIEGDLVIMPDTTGMQVDMAHWLGFRTVGHKPFCTVCRGRLRARGCRIGHNVQLGRSIWMDTVDLSQCRCEGSIITYCGLQTTQGYRIDGLVVAQGDLLLHDAVIDDNLLLNSTEIIKGVGGNGDVGLYATHIDGRLALTGLRCSGHLSLSYAQVKESMWATRTSSERAIGRPVLEIGGDLKLSGADIGQVMLSGIDVGKDVELFTGSFGQFIMDMGVEPDPAGGNTYWPKPCTVGSFEMSSVRIAERLDLSGLRTAIKDQGPLAQQLGAQRSAKQVAGVTIRQCNIGGNLSFFEPDPQAYLEERWFGGSIAAPLPWKRPGTSPSASPGTSQGTEPSTSDEVPATESRNEGLAPGEFRTAIRNSLDLQATTVGGHLDMRNMLVEKSILMNDVEVKLDVRMNHRANADDVTSAMVRTQCDHLDAEKLKCNGDVHLTGLTVGIDDEAWKDLFAGWAGTDRTPPSDAERNRSGTLKAREAQVKGEWLLQPRNQQRENERKKEREKERERGRERVDLAEEEESMGNRPWQALILGRLDLSAASINHLVLGRFNWPVKVNEQEAPQGTGSTAQEQDDEKAIVNLERGSFNRLEIVLPTPAPVSLSKITVSRWEFGKKEDAVDHYITVLSRMAPFDRAVWTRVERDLRDQARENDADKVYVAMREEAWRRRSKRLRENLKELRSLRHVFHDARHRWYQFWHTASRVALVHNTSVLRPMLPWLVMFVLSCWVFSDARNVELAAGTPKLVQMDGGAVSGKDPLLGIAPDGTGQRPYVLDIDRAMLDPQGEWNWRDGFFLACHYQIPLIDIPMHGQWAAGTKRPVQLLGIFSAEGWALLVRIYSYIAWSLLLIGLGAKAFRGKQ